LVYVGVGVRVWAGCCVEGLEGGFVEEEVGMEVVSCEDFCGRVAGVRSGFARLEVGRREDD
jgi:hypothetical protein